MPFGNWKKFVSLMLVLTTMLAPVEFAFAHSQAMIDGQSFEPMMEHDTHSAHMSDSHSQHIGMDMNADNGCNGDAQCADCVYCSPAISTQISLDVSIPSERPQSVAVAMFSTDLTREDRPPRSL